MTLEPRFTSLRPRAAQLPRLLLCLAACMFASCGGDSEPPRDDHYAMSEPLLIMSYAPSSVTSTYLKEIAVVFSNGSVVYTEWPEQNSGEPRDAIEQWSSAIDETTRGEGKALLTEELVANYEADSVPPDEENTSPHCRILVALPPSINNNYTIRLSENDTWSSETQTLLDYLFGVYDKYAPAP